MKKTTFLLIELLISSFLGMSLMSQTKSVSVKVSNNNQEIVFNTDGATYVFKTNKPVNFSENKNIVIPDSTDALLTEIRENQKIEAELKVNSSDYNLLFIQEGFLNEIYKDENDWLTHFFEQIVSSQTKNKEQGAIVESEIILKKDSVIEGAQVSEQDISTIDVFLNTLKGIVLEKDRFELLKSRIAKGTNIKEQKKIIGFIFSNFSLEQSKVDLINQLLDHPTYSKINNDFLMSFVDQFVLESSKVEILKKLIK